MYCYCYIIIKWIFWWFQQWFTKNTKSVPFFHFGYVPVLFCLVPSPKLTFTITSPSHTTTLYEGIPVNLTCTATIDTTIVNTPVTVSSMWIAPNGEQLTSSSSNDRITIVDMLQSAPYTSVLMFEPADDMDTGDYQCNITVVDNSSQPLILPSSPTAIKVFLNISGFGFYIYKLYIDTFLHAVVCESENTTTEQFGSYRWPATPVGDTVTLPCVFRPGYNASRSCTQGGSWIAVDVTDCRISE